MTKICFLYFLRFNYIHILTLVIHASFTVFVLILKHFRYFLFDISFTGYTEIRND